MHGIRERKVTEMKERMKKIYEKITKKEERKKPWRRSTLTGDESFSGVSG